MKAQQLSWLDLIPKKPKGFIHYRKAAIKKLIQGGCYKYLDKWARYYYNRTRYKNVITRNYPWKQMPRKA